MSQIVSVGETRDRNHAAARRVAGQVIHRDELRRVDVRASLAMAAAVVVAAVLIVAVTGRAWAPSYGRPVSAWLWWAGCTAWAVSVAVLVLALMPRPGWAEPRRYRAGGARTAGVVLRKYRLVRGGVLALAVAITLFAASGLR